MSKKQSLLGNIGVQVVIAMIIGTAVGAFMGESAEMFAPLGAIFINSIKMLVIPLVAGGGSGGACRGGCAGRPC